MDKETEQRSPMLVSRVLTRSSCTLHCFSLVVCSAGGGKGLIAMQVFSFIGLTAVLFLTTVRILGASISFLEPTRKVSQISLSSCCFS